MTDTLREATRQWTLAVPAVSAFVTSLVPQFQDRDDILQETAVAVIESYGRYDASLPFVAWAMGIARNQVRLHLRRQGRHRLAFDSDTVDALARTFVNQPVHDYRLDRLGECLDALDAHSKKLCQLRYEMEMKPAAIGERLRMAPNAVAKALQRIRDRLRECIERKSQEART